MNLRQKLSYIPFQDYSKKSENFLTKISNFPTTCHRETSHPPTPPPVLPPHEHTHPNVRLTFLVGKFDMCGFPEADDVNNGPFIRLAGMSSVRFEHLLSLDGLVQVAATKNDRSVTKTSLNQRQPVSYG